jgi:hypothetical protein
MSEQAGKKATPRLISWPMLLVMTAVFVAALALLLHNVLFTEGEVMQGLFVILIGKLVVCPFIGFFNRNAAFWCVVGIGGSLLLWQSYQNRKWAIIHEEIISIVRYAEEIKEKTGDYPPNLDGYSFKVASVKPHVRSFCINETNELYISYFMNNTGISYWYSSKTGFGYYPD